MSVAVVGLDRLKNAPNTMAGADIVRAFLQLQRTIGNKSLTELVARGSGTVQRDVVWDERHDLKWKDFKAKVPKGAKFYAETASGFKIPSFLQWKTVPLKDKCKIGKAWTWKVEGIVSTDVVDVKAVMIPGKSWIKHGKETPQLLEHEQGHFDISHVIGEKLETKMNDSRPGDFDDVFCGSKAAIKGVKAEFGSRKGDATKLIGEAKILSTRAQQDYDEDPKLGTSHGTKAKEQKQWEADIAANLPAYDLP